MTAPPARRLPAYFPWLFARCACQHRAHPGSAAATTGPPIHLPLELLLSPDPTEASDECRPTRKLSMLRLRCATGEICALHNAEHRPCRSLHERAA